MRKKRVQVTIMLVGIMLIACQPREQKETTSMKPRPDDHSYSLPQEARVTHLDWDAEVDFDSKMITGTASWKIKKEEEAGQIVFDTKWLEIKGVTDQEGNVLEFELGDDQEYMGSSLKIMINESTQIVKIDYQTSPKATALQWLSPEQTLEKNSPFLFTQSQAILARSWIPCQDSPGIRFTYNAKVKVPQGLLAVMSAENPQEINESGIYDFAMPQSVPSYLMALAVGDIKFQSVGPRTGVYAEKGMLEKAAWEFEDMEKMLVAAEELYGPYAWGRFDLIVLPPSFPFGGMENPRLTFATPTVIAGDRSLTTLVAHELAHSWSGNVVTNANWNDFWLNEGFTVYFERRIMEALYGESYSEMLAILGFYDLRDEVESLGENNPDTHLKLELSGRDPDEGMTDIAYEKGYSFLREIEYAVGREKFDAFLRSYFEKYAFEPMTTEVFLEFLSEDLEIPDKISEPDPKRWVFGPGIPEIKFPPKSQRFENVGSISDEFIRNGGLETEIMKKWTTVEWLQFLHSIPDSLSLEQIASLDGDFELSGSGNSEILFAWMKKLIRSEYDDCLPVVDNFLSTVGRRKFVLPLFEELVRKEQYKDWAKKVYQESRKNYHSVTYNSVDALFDKEA